MCKFSNGTFLYVKSQAVRLGCKFSYCIAFQVPLCSVVFVNGSIVAFFPKTEVLTFEHSRETLRVPARLTLEQGRQHKQILDASTANTSLIINV